MTDTIIPAPAQIITILRGHVSPETAYVVDDYPYSFRLRCKIRYWHETKKKFGTRRMAQTTNPRLSGEVWNKPKVGIYSEGFSFFYLDENDHVISACLGIHSPKKFVDRLMTEPVWGMFDSTEQTEIRYYKLLIYKLAELCEQRSAAL